MEARSVSDLLRELDKDILYTKDIFEDFTKYGVSNSIWNAITVEQRNAFVSFVKTRCTEAKEQKSEYGYFFWNRMLKRLVEDKTPIGEEINETL
jgi:hypothetical protein